MADDRKRGAKSESLTIRLNPRTRFVLEFVARMRGQTITTVVERALEAAGDQARVPQESGDDNTWKNYWDISDGVRALRMATEPELFPTWEEERRLKFAQQFWEYFYTSNSYSEYRRVYIDILWPRIDEFIQIHDDSKTTEYYKVEREMRAAIMKASVKPPKSKAGVGETPSQPEPAPNGSKGKYDLDDDIPF